MPVSWKRALKCLLFWCSLKMTFALCKFSVKKSDSPWMRSRQLPSLPLVSKTVFVLKRLKEFKVTRFGWDVSWWLGTLIANIRGGCQVGDVIVCSTCEEWILVRARRCAGRPLFWQACFEYQSFSGNMEMCGTRTGWLTHIYTRCVSILFLCWCVDTHWQPLCGQVDAVVRWITVALLLCVRQQSNWFSK